MTKKRSSESMLAVQTAQPGGPEVLAIGEVPRPVPSGTQLLIEVRAAGVNRPDIAQRRGKYPPPPGASPILGLEVAGIVVARGDSATAEIGESVCALAPGGGYAQYCLCEESHTLPVPRGWSFVEAAGVPETFFTVWANVFQAGALRGGEKLLVHGGASGIGTTAIQLASAFGAEVFVTAGSDEKCAACAALGARHAINYRKSDFAAEISRLTSGKGVNLILDMIGGEYAAKNIDSLAPFGRLVQIATQSGAEACINLVKVMQKRLTITGSTLRPRSKEEKAGIASELLRYVWPLLGEKKVRVVVDRIFPFADVRRAHEYLEGGTHVGKVILELGGDSARNPVGTAP